MLEEEIDTLKEGSSELAELKAKAALADSRSTEIEKLVYVLRWPYRLR